MNGSEPLAAAASEKGIPLLQRPRIYLPNDGCADLTLIHDYAGNYHEYESCQGAETATESYVCKYMQFVSTFVYFSHHLITIPPPTWINTCHRNGVKVLGTFIIEPGTHDIRHVLQRTPNKDSYVLADRLVSMAKCYGFDGWLVNIEKSFPVLTWNADRMVEFLNQLKKQLGEDGKVIW